MIGLFKCVMRIDNEFYDIGIRLRKVFWNGNVGIDF